MKITVIGGAGVRTVFFIKGLLARYKKLGIDTVVLFDIDAPKLDVIGKLCQHVIQSHNESLIVKTETDLETALQSVDYVVTTLRVGNDHSRVVDETTALRHGIIGQETTGYGGFSMAVRTIPVLKEYCALIQKVAPHAWIFNFTNPSGMVTQALRDAGYDKVIGICDAPSSTKIRMAKAMNVCADDLYVEFFGLNHLSWIKRVTCQGKDCMEQLLKDENFLAQVEEFSMFDPALIQSIKHLPNEYLYYYYHREKALANILNAGTTRGLSIEKFNAQMFEELYNMDIDANPDEALQIFLYYMELRESSYMSIEANKAKEVKVERGSLPIPDSMGYAGVMLDCIEGLKTTDDKYLVLSVPNNGTIDGFADNDVVEVTCKVSQKGFEPVHIGQIPEEFAVLAKTIKLYENLTIESINQHSKELAIKALTIHPLINSYSLAKALIDETL